MFVPEYTITSDILRNISSLEYAKAIIENTIVLPSLEKHLSNEVNLLRVRSNLELEGYTSFKESINSHRINAAIEKYKSYVNQQEPVEFMLKGINAHLTSKIVSLESTAAYRSTLLPNKVAPEGILIDIVELFDWLNSIDARDMHPIVVAAILKARLEQICCFDDFNTTTSNLLVDMVLKMRGYGFKDTVFIENYYAKGKKEYINHVTNITSDTDYTSWIEYFSLGLTTEAVAAQDKYKLLAKDTKIAKATKRIRLSERQEKIVEFIQDYGMLQNKDFTTLFPDKSEDSILRDLKVLIDSNIIQKSGSTKSSRYELK